MPAQYSHKGRHGSYQLSLEDNMIIATIVGAMSEKLSRHFYQDVIALAKTMEGKPWGYIADAQGYEASTPEASAYFRKLYLHCVPLGCIIDAYCSNSTVGIAQLDKVRSDCNFKTSIYDRLYDDLASAKIFVRNYLKQTTASWHQQ